MSQGTTQQLLERSECRSLRTYEEPEVLALDAHFDLVVLGHDGHRTLRVECFEQSDRELVTGLHLLLDTPRPFHDAWLLVIRRCQSGSNGLLRRGGRRRGDVCGGGFGAPPAPARGAPPP